MKKEYEVLFTPAKIGSLELKNRFVMVPMEPTACLEWSFNPVGFRPGVRDILINRAKDGIGLLDLGAICIYSIKDRTNLADHPEAFNGVKELMDEIHTYGSKVFFQLTAGAGRNFPMSREMGDNFEAFDKQMQLGLTAASADAGMPNRWVPEIKTRALTVDEIHEIIESMAQVAYYCKENGVDGVDIHAVHEGYLLDQFAMPYTNHRTDEYGGSLENRLRFACEIVKAIKAKCGDDYPVILRYSVTSRVRDWGKGIIPADTDSVEIGRDIEESKKAIKILSDAGYDAFNADNGTYDAWYYAHPPVYMPMDTNLKESIEVSPFTDKPIINAGKLRLESAAEAINKGQIQFMGIGRRFLTDEKFLTKIREEREEDIRPCIGCHTGCFPMGLWPGSGCMFGHLGNCALNPYTANEKKYEVKQSEDPKHFAVIGAGIAGMEFALRAIERGHTVDLYEKSDRLGGVFNEAASFSFKDEDKALLKFYETQLSKSDVKVHLNSEIKSFSDLDADEIVVATGSTQARSLQIPGNGDLIAAVDFLKGDLADAPENVVIVGGGLTGCEIAYELALKGKKPVVVEVLDNILKVKGSSMANTSFLRDAFEYYKVPVYTEASVTEVTDGVAKIKLNDGSIAETPADKVVISIGYINGVKVEGEMNEHIHVIGDADRVANLLSAIKAANDLVIQF